MSHASWKMRVRGFFDDGPEAEQLMLTDMYDTVQSQDVLAWLESKRRSEIIVDFAESWAKGIAIDLGCGWGDNVLRISRKADYTIGLDLSPKSLNRAKKFLRLIGRDQSCDLIACDLESIPLRNGVVDCLLLVEVIQYLTHRKKFFDEMARVSKEGTKALVLSPNFGGVRMRLEELLAWVKLGIGLKILSATSNLSTSSIESGELVRMAHSSGFSVLEWHPFWLPPWWLIRAVRNRSAAYSIDQIGRKLEPILSNVFGTQLSMIMERVRSRATESLQ